MGLIKTPYIFPDPPEGDEEGVVAIGGPMNAERLLCAYKAGVFPWSGDPVRWCSPDPRGIIWKVRTPRRLGRMFRKGRFEVSFDCAFKEVMQLCAKAHEHEGVWIKPSFVDAYSELHRMGYAHSVEVWQDGKMAGGLYGVQIGGLFAGESMFYHVSNASKIAFVALVYHLAAIGVMLLDCQMVTEHTEKLGAVWMRREDYLCLLDEALQAPVRFSGERWPAHGVLDIDLEQ
ncbi:MAG: leucyl/phenylalanyl-tRNA--protein transferase [Pseudomonadota bacterium]